MIERTNECWKEQTFEYEVYDSCAEGIPESPGWPGAAGPNVKASN